MRRELNASLFVAYDNLKVHEEDRFVTKFFNDLNLLLVARMMKWTAHLTTC